MIRLLGVGFIIIGHLIPIVIGRAFRGKDLLWAVQKRQDIARVLVRFLNIRVKITGQPALGHYLYVSNHRSYLDPVCTALYLPFVPIAKAEVGRWPVIGWAARMTGVFYVKRADRHSREGTRAAVREALRAKWPVMVYPEGTTAAQGTTLPFRPGTFILATEEAVGVVPIAIEYASKEAAWVGDDTFIGHFLRCFSDKKGMDVHIHFFDPIFDDNHDHLLKKSQTMIDQKLVNWITTPTKTPVTP